jgi:hypothetical protein
LDTPAEGREFKRADSAPLTTRGDGRLGIADWVQAGRFFARLDNAPQTGGPAVPAPPAFSAEITNQALIAERGWRFVNLATSNFSPERGGFIDVELDAAGDESALGFTINFNPSQLRFRSLERGADASRAIVLSNTNQSAQGEVSVALSMPPGQTFEAGKRQLIRLRFQPLRVDQDIQIGFSDGRSPIEIVDANAMTLPSRFEGMTIRFDPAKRRGVKIIQ